ncbi:MAG: hypothetical protein JNM81_01000 [Rhodospirillaceae bacterium]|nr:hypothetical protein [Rhodospirillaceae bacterium]
MNAIIDFLQPYYQHIRFVHLTAVMVWVWSTSVAYAYYLLPVFKAWRRNPDDQQIIELRNWVMERFDHGVIYEHIAFPIVIIAGIMLYIVGGHSTAENWLLLKLAIVIGVFIPIEITDYYLSHFGGNKHKLRKAGSAQDYERGIQLHWWFFLITTAVVMLGGTAVIFLAVVKPF